MKCKDFYIVKTAFKNNRANHKKFLEFFWYFVENLTGKTHWDFIQSYGLDAKECAMIELEHEYKIYLQELSPSNGKSQRVFFISKENEKFYSNLLEILEDFEIPNKTTKRGLISSVYPRYDDRKEIETRWKQSATFKKLKSDEDTKS